MTKSAYFLGVDGGGTKTEFVCVDQTGQVLARHVTGTTYHLQVGLEGAVVRLCEGVTQICNALGIAPASLDFAFFGLPAFGEDRVIDAHLHAACGNMLAHDRYACGNDMVCGWAGSLDCKDGINLVAGTGSIGYGERQGKSARIGGWGEVFGDEGSAYWIAVQGLNLFSRMSDGRLPVGALHTLVCKHLNLSTGLDLCERVMGPQGMMRDEIAALAPLVSDAAAQGDAAALDILKTAARELALMAETLRISLGFETEETVPLSWSGGVMTQQSTVRQLFIECLSERTSYQFVKPIYTPAIGAANYARHISLRPA